MCAGIARFSERTLTVLWPLEYRKEDGAKKKNAHDKTIYSVIREEPLHAVYV